jgi:isoleucyl-tRNA synthetase
MAPFAPFLAEQLYRNLNEVTGLEQFSSVHLATMPTAVEASIDADLESRMEHAEKIVMLVRAMRMKSNLKVRQPLRRIILPIAHEREREEVRQMEEVILDEINVKAVEYVTDESGLVGKKARANFKSIGPKFGKSVQNIAQRIKEMSVMEIGELERTGAFRLPLNGETVTVTREDVDIVREDIAGWLVESDGDVTVALDTTLDDRLLAEGFAREFVNRVQNMRKDAGFEVTDRINIYCKAPEKLQSVLESMASYIMNETLAVEFSSSYRAGEYASKLDINGEEIDVGIERRT